MAQEKLTNRPEAEQLSPETLEVAAQQRERLGEIYKNKAEKEKTGEQTREREKIIAEKEAREQASSKETLKLAPEKEQAPSRERRGAPSKAERKKAHDSTLQSIRRDMSAPAKAFSKLIHSRPVEVASEVIGSTVARPNAIVSASASALLFTTAVFIIARYYGYPLSGFESIGSFILGWCVGMVYDYIRSGLSAKRR